jgi:hypothetical protein
MKRISILRIFPSSRMPASGGERDRAGSFPALQKDAGGERIRACGGCGAAFLVDAGLTVLPVYLDGVPRDFCACCQEFLGRRIPSSELARTPGFDDEGQVLNYKFPALTPTEKKMHRLPENQFRLGRALREHLGRMGLEPPAPLFLAT